jgi:hypothetical protein
VSKEINWDEPLSDFDRQYALDRLMHDKVRENDERFGAPEKRSRTLEAVQGELAEARQRVMELEAERNRLANPNVATQTPTDGTFPPVTGTAVVGVSDNTVVDGEKPEGAPEDDADEYDGWTKADLVDEIDERNKMDNTNISTTGTKAELIERLRADDQRRASAQG